MSNESSSLTFNRCGSAGAAAKPLPVFRVRKRSALSGSGKSVSYEPNHTDSVRTRREIPATEAFHEMFLASRPKFVAIAYSILRSIEDAEDAVQSAFISGYLHLRDFQGRSHLKTWFTRVVLNAALMIRRKRKAGQLVSAPEWAAEESDQWFQRIPSPEPDPETRSASAEELRLIEGLTAQLRPPLREAFSMYYGQDMSVRQASLAAGVSTSTFKARLLRAKWQVIRKAKRALVFRPHKRVSDEFSLSAVSYLRARPRDRA